ncbi:MAG TPA: hypothetical protein VFT39_08065 [Vicinamibacterales bacterium]|nr:hypothetical protein [Vicinamibacterales bacterium]
MPLVHVALVVITLAFQDAQPPADCKEWQECRQLALEAAERQDYERFHDLAWRTVQKGPKNDAAIMYLLARAQSLSGRPGDALVMLQRLAQMGTKTDAATNDDFRRVRALPGWAALETGAGGLTGTQLSPASPTTQPRDVVANRAKPPAAENSTNAAPKPVDTRPPASGVAPTESIRFTAAASTPAGIAYDAVSRRFIVGDRDARKLTVVDEFSQHVANLASAQSAGFGNIAALEIDPRQGNLWVVSSDSSSADNATGTTAAARTTLHKLQLISGRVLQSFALPDRLGAARFADVAVTADSTVLVLDDSGQRIFRLRSRGADLEIAAGLKERVSTIAPASDALIYAATTDGIVVIDLSSKAVTPLKAAAGVDLARLSRLRWHKGSLIGIQQSESSYRAVRIALDSTGRRATGQQILDASLATIDPTAATIAGGVLYYLASGDGAEMVIRKITLP